MASLYITGLLRLAMRRSNQEAVEMLLPLYNLDNQEVLHIAEDCQLGLFDTIISVKVDQCMEAGRFKICKSLGSQKAIFLARVGILSSGVSFKSFKMRSRGQSC